MSNGRKEKINKISNNKEHNSKTPDSFSIALVLATEVYNDVKYFYSNGLIPFILLLLFDCFCFSFFPLFSFFLLIYFYIFIWLMGSKRKKNSKRILKKIISSWSSTKFQQIHNDFRKWGCSCQFWLGGAVLHIQQSR